mgnify:CR=1 FL=1
MTPNLHTSEMRDAQATFFDLSLDLQLVLDDAGLIVLCNNAFAKMVNKPGQELVGTPLIAYCDSGNADAHNALTRIPQNQYPTSFECTISHFDDTPHRYIITLYPQPNGTCHVIGKDITPYREMENRESERNIFAEALLDTVLTINTSLALEQVLERILANIGKVVDYDHVTIILVNNQQAEVVGSLRKAPYHLDVTLDTHYMLRIPDHPSLAQMLVSQDYLILPQVDEPPAWMTNHHSHRRGSFLGAPIIVDTHVIGFLGIFNTNSEFFTPLHAQQIITFANQAGIALQNARLYQQAQSAAILRERQRVAQEIHDSVNQELFAASTYADLLAKAVKKKPELVTKYALDVGRLVRGAVEQMRMILIELHPDALTNTGLDTLIKSLCDVLKKRVGLDVDFTANDSVILPEHDQVAFYRITQEALHNIEKHAQASLVHIDLQATPAAIQLTITDDGIGFDRHHIPHMHFGISGMHDRASRIGAALHIESQPNKGTKIILRKPLNE